MTGKTTAEILTLERAYWDALKAGDMKAALKLTSDPCIVAGAQGVAKLRKADFEKMSQAGPSWKLKDYEITDESVIRLSDDFAVVGYKVREEMTVEGEPLTLEAAETSTWVRKNGAWSCVLHSESVLGDPFGRDRTPA